MSGFSASEALASGFQVIRRRPAALLAWAAVYLAMGIGPQVLMWLSIWPRVSAQMAHPGADPAAMAQAMSGLTVLQPVIWAVSLVLMSILYGAVYRAVLTPQDRRFFYLRLSMKELWLGLTILAQIGVFIVGCVIAGAAVTLIGHSAPGIVTFIVSLAAVVGGIWLLMRFSLAGPMAFAETRFIFAESWRLTQGHALKLCGVALALLAMILAAELVVLVPLGIIGGLTGALSHAGQQMAADPVKFMRDLAPWLVLGGLAGSLVAAALHAILGGPWAEIYRELSAQADAPAE
ncbi:hypothetical protein [Phenylobacterium sp.]|uniref:hypothetical protein n=1 Tax=Phenylobacterium sp. TaxID=1871053 RepID=UPI00286B1B05|nr:hypothetical protein [Phenylobacterium sp.]